MMKSAIGWCGEVFHRLVGAVMIKFLVGALVVISTFRLTPGCAQSQKLAPRNADDYKIHQIAGRLGTEMFSDFLKENGPALRGSVILKACSKDGLAAVVEAKIIDRNFSARLSSLIAMGKFSGLPSYSLLQAQSVANGMVVGYQAGYQAAIDLTFDLKKSDLCDAAVELANRLLK
jgi:hypothetical protein